jgi:hypothetical protein
MCVRRTSWGWSGGGVEDRFVDAAFYDLRLVGFGCDRYAGGVGVMGSSFGWARLALVLLCARCSAESALGKPSGRMKTNGTTFIACFPVFASSSELAVWLVEIVLLCVVQSCVFHRNRLL